jgi:dihydroxyacetone kinase-like protein
MTSSLDTTEFIVRTIAQTCVDNEKYFGDLDSVVGDGDFGYSLARGFEQVLAHWDEYDRDDAGTFLLKVALAISSRIGGTSGPIWGTAFMRAGTALKGRDPISGAELVEALRASVEGIKKRGNSDVGDKTLLDALVPSIDALDVSVAAGESTALAMQKVAVAARSAADATSSLKAMRGRASYSGDRSIGSPDAGAVAVAVLAEELARTWNT